MADADVAADAASAAACFFLRAARAAAPCVGCTCSGSAPFFDFGADVALLCWVEAAAFAAFFPPLALGLLLRITDFDVDAVIDIDFDFDFRLCVGVMLFAAAVPCSGLPTAASARLASSAKIVDCACAATRFFVFFFFILRGWYEEGEMLWRCIAA